MVRSTLLALTLSSAIAYAQPRGSAQMQVLVLDYKTGQALRNRTVEILPTHQDGEIYSDSRSISRKTGKDGIALFRFTPPVPPVLYVEADFRCYTEQRVVTSDVLEHGVTTRPADYELCKGHTTAPWVARPGEVVVYVRRLNPWLRFWRFWWEVFES